MLCPPAAAISSALLAFSCPFTSLKSTIVSLMEFLFKKSLTSTVKGFILNSSIVFGLKKSTTSFRFSTGYTSMPSIRAASVALSFGTNIFLIPFSFNPTVIGRTPLTLLIPPSSESSPMLHCSGLFLKPLCLPRLFVR